MVSLSSPPPQEEKTIIVNTTKTVGNSIFGVKLLQRGLVMLLLSH